MPQLPPVQHTRPVAADPGRSAALEARVPTGDLIRGWDMGLIGLCEGAKGTLVIPPALGYGSRGLKSCPPAGLSIPPGATLNFAVELTSVVAKDWGTAIGRAPAYKELLIAPGVVMPLVNLGGGNHSAWFERRPRRRHRV